MANYCKEVPQVEIVDMHAKTDVKIVNKCNFMSSAEHCVNRVIFTYEPRVNGREHLDDYIIK